MGVVHGAAGDHPLDVVVQVRRAATRALAGTLERSRGGESEAVLTSRWMAGLSAIGGAAPAGWYVPPPGGAAILIGHPPAFDRIDFASLRDRASWPSDEVTLRDDSVLTAYASPFHRATGLIADVQATIYRGNDEAVHNHLRECLHTVTEIATACEVGMTLAEVGAIAQHLMARSGKAASSRVFSPSDPHLVNIGHTIPWADGGYAHEDRLALDAALDDSIIQRIRLRRQFINGFCDAVIGPTTALTIEPRLVAVGLPAASYHCIVIFRGGERRIVTGFAELFGVLGMTDRFDRGDLETLDTA